LGSWNDPLTIVSALVVSALIYYAFSRITKKEVVVYGILYFLISIFMFSNFAVPAVGIVAERFAFGASVGFSIVISFLLLRVFRINASKESSELKLPPFARYTALALLLVCGIHIINRNMDWKSRFSIYSADIHKVPGSAKLHALLGTEHANQLEQNRKREQDPNSLQETGLKKKNEGRRLTPLEIEQKIDSAIYHFEAATKIFPGYKTMHNNLGTIYFTYKQNGDSAGAHFKIATVLDSTYAQALFNYSSVYELDAGKYTLMEQVFRRGLEMSDSLPKGRIIFKDSLKLDRQFNNLRKLESDLLAFSLDLSRSASKEDLEAKRKNLPAQVTTSLQKHFTSDDIIPNPDTLILFMNVYLDQYFMNQLQMRMDQLVRVVIGSACGKAYVSRSLAISGIKDSTEYPDLIRYAIMKKIDSYKSMVIYLNKTLQHKDDFLIAFDKLQKLYQDHKAGDSLISLNSRYLDHPRYQHEQLMINIGNGYLLKNKIDEAIEWYLKAAEEDKLIISRIALIHNQFLLAKNPSTATLIYKWYAQKMKEVSDIYAMVGRKYNDRGDTEKAFVYLTESEKYKVK
jgi:tetratricopeptide (TPR) repeat protein